MLPMLIDVAVTPTSVAPPLPPAGRVDVGVAEPPAPTAAPPVAVAPLVVPASVAPGPAAASLAPPADAVPPPPLRDDPTDCTCASSTRAPHAATSVIRT